MSELASLEKSLLDLLSLLDSKSFPIILGGGYGLYLRRTILEREGTRTLLEHWPEARSTNDLDLFLRPELLCDSNRFLLTGPRSSFEDTGLKVDERRVRPNPSVKVHAHPTDEAITLEENLQEVKLYVGEDGEQSTSVFLPHPFTYALMKLFAFRDQIELQHKGYGSHHALDLYSIIAMMTENEWELSKEMAKRNSDSAIGVEASRIANELFDSTTSRGLLVMRANPYCSDQLQLSEFIDLVRDLLSPSDSLH